MLPHGNAGKLEIGIPEAPANRKIMAGRYYSGPYMGGAIALVLKRNGTFTAESHVCGSKSGESSGTWSLSNTQIVLTPKKEKGLIEGRLHAFEVRRGKGRWFLVQGDDSGCYGKRLFFEKSEQK
jgi:hypothetical protein